MGFGNRATRHIFIGTRNIILRGGGGELRQYKGTGNTIKIFGEQGNKSFYYMEIRERVPLGGPKCFQWY